MLYLLPWYFLDLKVEDKLRLPQFKNQIRDTSSLALTRRVLSKEYINKNKFIVILKIFLKDEVVCQNQMRAKRSNIVYITQEMVLEIKLNFVILYRMGFLAPPIWGI